MDKYDLDKKIVKLEEILSDIRGIYEEVNFLRSRLDEAIYELEKMRSDLEMFGDELDEEK